MSEAVLSFNPNVRINFAARLLSAASSVCNFISSSLAIESISKIGFSTQLPGFFLATSTNSATFSPNPSCVLRYPRAMVVRDAAEEAEDEAGDEGESDRDWNVEEDEGKSSISCPASKEISIRCATVK